MWYINMPISLSYYIYTNTSRKIELFITNFFMILFNNPKENIWIQRVWSLEVLKHKFTFRLLYDVVTWIFYLWKKINVFVVLLCQNCLIESNKVCNYVCAWEECGDFVNWVYIFHVFNNVVELISFFFVTVWRSE